MMKASNRRNGGRERSNLKLEPLEPRVLLSVTTLLPPTAALLASLDVNASSQAGTQSEIGIAVNPTNPLNMVAVANNNTNLSDMAAYFSTDGGVNWTASFIDDTEDGQGAGDTRFDPNVAFDSDGQAYVLYSLNTGAASRLMLVRSSDGGATWTQATTVTTDAANSNLHTASLTTRTDPSGADDVLVIWARVGVGGETIQAALSTDAGATFPTSNAQINDGAPERTFMPWAAPDEFGNFHVTWEVNIGGTTPDGILYHDVLDATTLADGADTTVSNLMLTDFAQAISQIPAQPNRGLFSVSSVDVDLSGGPHDGRVYVVYSDRINTSSNDVDIYLRHSDNNGATWSAPIQVNDDATTTSQFMPRMDIDQTTGNIYVAWYDARLDTVDNRAVNVFAAVSNDGGATWSPNIRVAQEESDVAIPGNNGNDYTEYMGLSARPGGAYIAWTDKRASNFGANNEDVFVGLVTRAGMDVTIAGDLNGTPTNDAIVLSLDPSGLFAQVTIGGGTPVFSQPLAALNTLTIDGLGGNDTLTVDYANGDPIPVGGLLFMGGTQTGTPGDSLVVAGNGPNHGIYTPDSLVPGSGVVTVDGSSITFIGLEPVTVSGFHEFTFVTPNSQDVVTVDSPAAGQNRISGTSGGVAFESLTFFDVDHFRLDTATNDGPIGDPDDSVTFTADLVATDLDSFTVDLGAGNDTADASLVTSPVPLTLLGGDGDDRLTDGSGDDRLEGGDGNDFIFINTGDDDRDVAVGGQGDDDFVYRDNDRTNRIDGNEGFDKLSYQCLATDDDLRVALGGDQFISRVGGFVTADFGSIESISINTQGETTEDRVTVFTAAESDVRVLTVIMQKSAGSDRVVVEGSPNAETVNFGEDSISGFQISGFATIIRLTAVTAADTLEIRGNAGNDSITQTTTSLIQVILDGGDGNDVLSADAILNGGAGNDILIGGAGNDTMDGGDGDDTFVGNGGTDTVTGGNGFDTILVPGIPGIDAVSVAEAGGSHAVTSNAVLTIYAAGSTFERILVQSAEGNDNVTASGAVVGLLVEAGAGNDTVDASAATNAVTLLGEAGDDWLIGGSGADRLEGGEGNDRFDGGPGDDRMFGGSGSDAFFWSAGRGSDLVEGGAGADELAFGDGAAGNRMELFGGGGNFVNPTFGTAGAANRAIVALNSTAFLTASVFVDTAEVEAIAFDTQGGADQVILNNQAPNASTAGSFLQTGTDLASTSVESIDVLTGSSDGAADRVEVHGRIVADNVLITNTGTNFGFGPIDVAGFAYSVRIDQTRPADGDLLVVRGGAGNDTIKAEAGVEDRINIRLDGDAGDDFLSADAILNGGPGNDTIITGLGDDTIDGGLGIDRVVSAAFGDTSRDFTFILSDTQLIRQANAVTNDTDTLTGIEEAELTGGTGDDSFQIGAFTRRALLTSGEGSDTVDFSAAPLGATLDLDLTGSDQRINSAVARVNLADAIENFVGSDFNDQVKADALSVPRSIDGGAPVKPGPGFVPPGDLLTVDGQDQFVNVNRIIAGQPSDDSGTATAFGYAPITFTDIEKLAITNTQGSTGFGGFDLSAYVPGANYSLFGNDPGNKNFRSAVAAGNLDPGNADPNFAGNTWQDLVVVHSKGAGFANVLLNRGDGTFQGAVPYATGLTGVGNVALADVDGDGTVDIVAAGTVPTGLLKGRAAISVLTGNGDGTFNPFVLTVTSLKDKPVTMALGDVDGTIPAPLNGPDIVLATGKRIRVLLNDGAGAFAEQLVLLPTDPFNKGKAIRHVQLADLDGDNRLDLVGAAYAANKISVFGNVGAGAFGAPTSYATVGDPRAVAIGDLNNDGLNDIAVAGVKKSGIGVLLGQSGGTFRVQPQAGSLLRHYESVSLGDVNSDGKLDLVLAHEDDKTDNVRSVYVLLGTGNGTFSEPYVFAAGDAEHRQPSGTVLADFNSDGGLDIAMVGPGTFNVSLLLKNTVI